MLGFRTPRGPRGPLRITQDGALLAAALVVSGVAALLSAAPARAEVRQVAFPVKGMVCPLCTRGVEASIRQLTGVGLVAADLATGRVQVDAQDRQTLNIQEVRQRAAQAGFPASGDADVVARGRFEIGHEGRITFKVAGTTYAWQVLESDALLDLFRQHPGLRGEYIVSFRLREHVGSAPAAISVFRWEPGPPPVIATKASGS